MKHINEQNKRLDFNKIIKKFIDGGIEAIKSENPMDRLRIKLLLPLNFEDFILNPETGKFDVYGNVNLKGKKLAEIPFQLGKVTGYFDCSENRLTLLEGCPEYVGGDFDCCNNLLLSSEASPQHVEGYFDCSENRLTSLKGAPEYVGNYFDCMDNPKLKSLKGIGKVADQIYSDFFEGPLDSYKGEL